MTRAFTLEAELERDMEIKETFKSAVQSERRRNRPRVPRIYRRGRRKQWYAPPELARHVRERPATAFVSALSLGLAVAAVCGGWMYARSRRRGARSMLDRMRLP